MRITDLMSGLEDIGWQIKSNCRGAEDLFRSDLEEDSDKAKELCQGCDVREKCLDYALENENEIEPGIWGGMNEEERRSISISFGRQAINE